MKVYNMCVSPVTTYGLETIELEWKQFFLPAFWKEMVAARLK